MSQTDLVEKLKERGIPYANPTLISRIESGIRPVRLVEGDALARIFDTPMSSLVHPSPSEPIIIFATLADTQFRQSFAKLRGAAQDAGDSQRLLAQWPTDVETIVNDDKVPSDLRARAKHLLWNMRNALAIDLKQVSGDEIDRGLRANLGEPLDEEERHSPHKSSE